MAKFAKRFSLSTASMTPLNLGPWSSAPTLYFSCFDPFVGQYGPYRIINLLYLKIGVYLRNPMTIIHHGLTVGSTRTPPAFAGALFLVPAFSAPLSSSAQAVPVNLIR